jgi:hypothetical protein
MAESKQNDPGEAKLVMPSNAGDMDEDGNSLEEKELRVLELRRAGFTFQRIAEEVGYKQASGAQRALERIMARNIPQLPKEYVWQELDRLDRMQVALWPRAMKGDDRAINTIIRLMERRAGYLGIDAPTKVQAEVVNYDGTRDIDGDIERIVNLIRGVDTSEPMEMESGTGESGTIAAIGELEDMVIHGGAWSGQNTNSSGVVGLGSDNQTDDTLGDSSPDLR